MVVQHNISAMTANRYYGINNSALGKSLEKLSSGYAINRAGDNAAGLAVSEKMRAQIAGLTQASKNAQDGISMVQTYEGALQETDSILQRMRTIAVQSANGSYQNDVDRDALQLEFDQLNDELNQIADTDFNGVVALNGGIMADGTVVNDTTKVAQRPDIANVSATPNATFTYSSSANGTVDGAGNGSLTINGVALKLSQGQGSATLGNASTGVTSYVANVGVNNGAVSGTVSVNETYIAEDAAQITIHGQSFSIDNSGLKDSDGNSVSAIDGLNVTMGYDSSGTKVTSVNLSGKYLVEDNVVRTDRSFSAKSSNQEVSNLSSDIDEKNTPAMSGLSIEFNDAANGNPYAGGKLTVNGKTVTLDPTSATDTWTQGTNVSWTATNISADKTSGKITGNVSATGTLTANTTTANVSGTASTTNPNAFTKQQTAAPFDYVTDADATFADKTSADAYGNVFKFSVTDNELKDENGDNKKYELTVRYDGTNLTIKGKTGDTVTFNGTDIYLDDNGQATDAANAITHIALTTQMQSTNKISDLTAANALDGTINHRTFSDANVFGNGVKVYSSVGADASGKYDVLKVVGDSSYKELTSDKSKVNMGNGLTIDVTAISNNVSGNFKLEDTIDTKNIGSFKISTGVSTSDSFNHGTANLTFADNMTLQVGSRSKDAVTFNFSYTTNGIGNLKSDLNASARGLGTDQVSVKTQEDANAAIDAVDNAINKVSMIRGTFGAIQNRLEHKINNIDTNAENLTAAESRIRDTQMDQEMMKFTSAQILSQASQSMLAQANSLPQGVLQLLG